jgi:DNA-binding transcriptional ArsR family regulator
MTTPAVLSHLRMLERAGAVVRREQGKSIYYSVALEEVSAALVAYNLRIRTLAPTSNAFDHAQTGRAQVSKL